MIQEKTIANTLTRVDIREVKTNIPRTEYLTSLLQRTFYGKLDNETSINFIEKYLDNDIAHLDNVKVDIADDHIVTISIMVTFLDLDIEKEIEHLKVEVITKY